jgi:hypothetical protein
MRVALLACVLVACGKGETTPKKYDAGVAAADAAAPVTVEEVPLGLPELASYQWRTRGGHPAFRSARDAEAKQDWPTVVTACRQALAADPSHLEAAWLLAAALGRQGKHAELLAPLQHAVAGDFGKWGHASLELPALQEFLATPTGVAWKARVEHDRAKYTAALTRALVVEADGDLYAFDAEAKRWHRLTRTYGAVVAALRVPATPKLVYITRVKKQFAAGTVDFAQGRTFKPIDLGTDQPIVVTYQTKQPNNGVWVGQGKIWRRLDETFKWVALPAKTTRPPGLYLEVRKKKAKLRALPLANVTADFDQHGLASAIRIGKSNRVVSVPSPGLIAGNSATWSADRSRLAFVAQLADECTPGSISSAAFIADAATGKLRELERAAKGLAVEWVGDRSVAIAGDSGVTIVHLDTSTTENVAGARGLVAPKQRPKCTLTEPDAPDADPEPDEPDQESGHVEPISPSDAHGH